MIDAARHVPLAAAFALGIALAACRPADAPKEPTDPKEPTVMALPKVDAESAGHFAIHGARRMLVALR
jgi:hypothetical protein